MLKILKKYLKNLKIKTDRDKKTEQYWEIFNRRKKYGKYTRKKYILRCF